MEDHLRRHFQVSRMDVFVPAFWPTLDNEGKDMSASAALILTTLLCLFQVANFIEVQKQMIGVQ